MAISQRQRRMLGSELRDLVFRVCSGGGAFAGLMWALKHTTATPRHLAVCKPQIGAHERLATHAFGQCLGSSLTSDILAWILPVLVGAGLGAGVGFLLASMVSLGRAGKSSNRVAMTNTAPGRWIKARYPGKCGGCGCSIVRGDRIRHRPGQALCASCGERT